MENIKFVELLSVDVLSALLFFFFSSRRRHTRLQGDWSSDVCSSDLAERIDSGLAVRVYPAFLYAGHPLASVNGSFNAVTIESPAITEITLSGPGAGGPQTASAVFGDVVSALIPPPPLPPPPVGIPLLPPAEP